MIVDRQLDGWLSDFFHNPLSTIVSTVKNVVSDPLKIVTTAVGIVFPPAIPALTALNAAAAVKQYVDIKKQNATALLAAQGNANAQAAAAAEMKKFEGDYVSTEADNWSELIRKRKNIFAKLGVKDPKGLAALPAITILRQPKSPITITQTAVKQPTAQVVPVKTQSEAERPLYETLLKANDVYIGMAKDKPATVAAQPVNAPAQDNTKTLLLLGGAATALYFIGKRK